MFFESLFSCIQELNIQNVIWNTLQKGFLYNCNNVVIIKGHQYTWNIRSECMWNVFCREANLLFVQCGMKPPALTQPFHPASYVDIFKDKGNLIRSITHCLNDWNGAPAGPCCWSLRDSPAGSKLFRCCDKWHSVLGLHPHQKPAPEKDLRSADAKHQAYHSKEMDGTVIKASYKLKQQKKKKTVNIANINILLAFHFLRHFQGLQLSSLSSSMHINLRHVLLDDQTGCSSSEWREDGLFSLCYSWLFRYHTARYSKVHDITICIIRNIFLTPLCFFSGLDIWHCLTGETMLPQSTKNSASLTASSPNWLAAHSVEVSCTIEKVKLCHTLSIFPEFLHVLVALWGVYAVVLDLK